MAVLVCVCVSTRARARVSASAFARAHASEGAREGARARASVDLSACVVRDLASSRSERVHSKSTATRCPLSVGFSPVAGMAVTGGVGQFGVCV